MSWCDTCKTTDPGYRYHYDDTGNNWTCADCVAERMTSAESELSLRKSCDDLVKGALTNKDLSDSSKCNIISFLVNKRDPPFLELLVMGKGIAKRSEAKKGDHHE